MHLSSYVPTVTRRNIHMSNPAEQEEEIKLAPPIEYTGHTVHLHRKPSKKGPKVYTGKIRIAEFPQTIVLYYDGRSSCFESDKWQKILKDNQLTLEATVEQPLHRPVRVDFFINDANAS